MTDQTLRRTVPCPTCKGPSLYSPDNAFRPFCSERCKNLDFGAWASERFRLAALPSPDDDPQSPGGHQGAGPADAH